MSSNSGFTIRQMLEADLAGADELRRVAGWNQTPEDWLHMLRLQPKGCFVAEMDRRVAGTVTSTSYGSTLAWIGMMLVHPEQRRKGIGRALMSQALNYLRDTSVRCVGLDATPAGYPLYAQLGFIPEWTLTRWERPGQRLPPTDDDPRNVRPMLEGDWTELLDLDAVSFGVPRPDLLRSLVQRSRLGMVWPAQGRVFGWGLLRPGARSDYVGPFICSTTEGAPSIIVALLRAAEERSVFWDIPDRNEHAKALAKQFGFVPVRPLTRMRLGQATTGAEHPSLFAVADPAVG